MGDADQVTHLANGGHLAKLANWQNITELYY